MIFWNNCAERRPSSESGSPACKQTQGYEDYCVLGERPSNDREHSHRPRHLLARWLNLDFRVYDSEEGRKEHAGDLVAALGDLAETVRDFVSQFPRRAKSSPVRLRLRSWKSRGRWMQP